MDFKYFVKKISSFFDNVNGLSTTGTITANAGNIGGWTIEDGQLSAGAGNSSVTMSGEDQLIRIDTKKLINNITHQIDSEIWHLLMNIILKKVKEINCGKDYIIQKEI